jgi:hypothetical protein
MNYMATNINNIDDTKDNLFILSGEEEDKIPYDYGGMPEYVQENQKDLKLTVRFRNRNDMDEFGKLINQKITEKAKSIWHPIIDRDTITLLRWVDEDEEI